MSEIRIPKKNRTKLIFTDEDIKNYYLSLKTKPFVILMGLSGSGKTKLALRFAEAMTGRTQIIENKNHYTVVPVEADWIESKNLLGFYNPLMKTYSKTPFLDIILRARFNYFNYFFKKEELEKKLENHYLKSEEDENNVKNNEEDVRFNKSNGDNGGDSAKNDDSDNTPEENELEDRTDNDSFQSKAETPIPYFIILDEMNLSKVEYYFSKFLSALETKELRCIQYYTDKKKLIPLDLLLTESIDLHYENSVIEINKGPKEEPDINNEAEDESEAESEKNFEKELKKAGKDISSKLSNETSRFYFKFKKNNNDIIYAGYDKENNSIFDIISKDGNYIPPEITITPNIYFTGTVNVDETTYMFSPKVLDRANSIELTEIDLEKFKNSHFITLEVSIDVEEAEEESEVENKEAIQDDLDEDITLDDLTEDFTYGYEFQLNPNDLKIFEPYIDRFYILLKYLSCVFNIYAPKFNFGYRIVKEMQDYIINALNLLGDDEETFIFALDLQLKQKILPKIHGMKSELIGLFGDEKDSVFNKFFIENLEKKFEEGSEAEAKEEVEEKTEEKTEQIIPLKLKENLEKVGIDENDVKYILSRCKKFIEKIKRMKEELNNRHFTSYM